MLFGVPLGTIQGNAKKNLTLVQKTNESIKRYHFKGQNLKKMQRAKYKKIKNLVFWEIDCLISLP